MNLKESLLKTFIENSSSDTRVIDVVRNSFRVNELYSPLESVLGDDNDVRKIISDGINVVDDDDSRRIIDSLNGTKIETDEIYQHRKIKLNSIYNVCLASIVVTIIVIIIGLIFSFIQERTADLVSVASGTLTSLISGTAFVIYKRANKDLKKIEVDIIKLNKLILFFKMIDSIPDNEVRTSSYEIMTKQMLNEEL